MAPDLPGTLSLLVAGNGYQGEVSADAAGIISTLFTLNAICYFCGARQSDRFSTLHSRLLDYAETHEEAKKIFAAID